MYQVLSELNKTPGITGSMVVGKDGIVIAADLEASLEGDTVGALAASITSNIQKSLDRLSASPLAHRPDPTGDQERDRKTKSSKLTVKI